MSFRGFIDWLTGSGSTSSRDQILHLKLTVRKLDRSKKKLEMEERRLKAKIQESMKKGDLDAARQYATDMVRSRKWALGYQKLSSKINGLIFKLERVDAASSLGKELYSVAQSLRIANANLHMPDIDRLVTDIEGQMDKVDMSTDTLEDGLDNLLVGDTDTAEIDRVLAQTAAEVGIDTTGLLPAPSGQQVVQTSDLESEIEKLRRQESD